MTALTAIAATTAAIDLAEKLLPVIQELFNQGEITPEEQAEVRRRYESLKARADGQFQGPEWQVSTEAGAYEQTR